MQRVQRLSQLYGVVLLIALARASEYGPPKYGEYEPPKYGVYEPPKYGVYEPPKYGYGSRPNVPTGVASILKDPAIFTIMGGDNKLTTEIPIELHINLTLPENGIPPTRLKLGNVAGYLNQRPGGPKPNKHTVLVDIKNQNKPFKPIPANVFQAGLPQGSLLPPDRAGSCKKLISESCKAKCSTISRSCKRICKSLQSCIDNCEKAKNTCTGVCDHVKNNALLTGMEDGKLTGEAKIILLTKCLRHCKTNTVCIAKCRDVCKDKLVEGSLNPYEQYPVSQYGNVPYFRDIASLAPQIVQALRDDFLQLNSAGISDNMLASLLGLADDGDLFTSLGLPDSDLVSGISDEVFADNSAERERGYDVAESSSDVPVEVL